MLHQGRLLGKDVLVVSLCRALHLLAECTCCFVEILARAVSRERWRYHWIGPVEVCSPPVAPHLDPLQRRIKVAASLQDAL